jgi:hypothetical protein
MQRLAHQARENLSGGGSSHFGQFLGYLEQVVVDVEGSAHGFII